MSLLDELHHDRRWGKQFVGVTRRSASGVEVHRSGSSAPREFERQAATV
jgi:hypothetical protein